MPAWNDTINTTSYLFIAQSLAMLLYKWRYPLFSVVLLAELVSWLAVCLPAGIFFDAVPNFIFTAFMILFYCSPVICILYWSGLGWKYWRNAWGKADALACVVSVAVSLPKLLFIVMLLVELNSES